MASARRGRGHERALARVGRAREAPRLGPEHADADAARRLRRDLLGASVAHAQPLASARRRSAPRRSARRAGDGARRSRPRGRRPATPRPRSLELLRPGREPPRGAPWPRSSASLCWRASSTTSFGARSTKPGEPSFFSSAPRSFSIFFSSRSMRARSASAVTRPLSGTSTSMGPCALATTLTVVPGSRAPPGASKTGSPFGLHAASGSPRRAPRRNARTSRARPSGSRSGTSAFLSMSCSLRTVRAGGDDLLAGVSIHASISGVERRPLVVAPSGTARTRGSPCATPAAARAARAPR